MLSTISRHDTAGVRELKVKPSSPWPQTINARDNSKVARSNLVPKIMIENWHHRIRSLTRNRFFALLLNPKLAAQNRRELSDSNLCTSSLALEYAPIK
jgi:hypothetical protein